MVIAWRIDLEEGQVWEQGCLLAGHCLLIIQVRDGDGLDHDSSSRGNGKWSESKFILKESQQDVICEGVRESRRLEVF